MKGKRKPGGKKHSASTAAAAAAAETEKNKKKPKSLGQRIHQALFGWMDTVIKVRGGPRPDTGPSVVKRVACAAQRTAFLQHMHY
jgi:hypothetical protein